MQKNLEIAQKTNSILDKFETGKGNFKIMSEKEFLDEIEKW